MITRLKLRNYKNIRELDLKLGSLNVIIGPNGVGKSNVGRLLGALHNVLPTGTLSDFVSSLDGPLGLFPQHATQPESFQVSFSGSSPQGHDIAASISLSLSEDHSIEIADESYELSYATGRRVSFLRKSGNQWRRSDSAAAETGSEMLVPSDGGLESLAEPLAQMAHRLVEDGPYLLLPRAQFSRYFPQAEEFIRMTSELLFAWHDAIPSPLTFLDVQQMTRRNQYVLQPSTREFALLPTTPISNDLDRELQFIEWLYEERSRFDESRFVLENLLRASMPSFESFFFQPLSDGSRYVQVQSTDQVRPLSLGLMSNGFLAMLRLASAIAYRVETIQRVGIDAHARSPFYCEEPEVFLHPSAQVVLAEALIGLAEKTQVFVSTHSPSFLRHFPAEAIILSRFSPFPERGPEFRRLDEDEYAMGWLGEDGYSVGEAWTMGVFGD